MDRQYEASSVEGNSDSSADNVTTKHVKVQPGVSSWRHIRIGNMYNSIKKLCTKSKKPYVKK